ncbi:MAG: hypothetical protein NXI24_07365 [bacterium]|nr:hypothetical protein [bacterium]
MDSSERERENSFDKVTVSVLWSRFYQRSIAAPVQSRRMRSDTWAKTLIRNRSKLKPRLAEPLKERRRNNEWEHSIAKQKVRINKTLDPYVRWASCEQRLLRQVNEKGFSQSECYSHGLAWTFAASKQVEKMTLNRLPALLTPRNRRTDWPGARLRVWAEYKRLLNAPAIMRKPWDRVLHGMRRKYFQGLAVHAHWERRMMDSSRRWSGERR